MSNSDKPEIIDVEFEEVDEKTGCRTSHGVPKENAFTSFLDRSAKMLDSFAEPIEKLTGQPSRKVRLVAEVARDAQVVIENGSEVIEKGKVVVEKIKKHAVKINTERQVIKR